MKFAVSGANTAAVSPATASSRVLVMGSAVTSGRVFWLRGVSVAYNATFGPVRLVDASSGATATTPLLSIPLEVGKNEPTKVEIGPPGIRFSTGCAAFLDASGSIPIGEISAWGYEEG